MAPTPKAARSSVTALSRGAVAIVAHFFCHRMSIRFSLIRLTGRRQTGMKFMVIIKADKNSEAGEMPSQQLLEDMTA